MDKKLYETIKRMNYTLKKHINGFDETSWLTGHRYSDKEVVILNACFEAGRLTSHGFKPCEDYEKILEIAKSSDMSTKHKKHTLMYAVTINTGLVQFIKRDEPNDKPEAVEQKPEEPKQQEKTEQKKQPAKKSAAKAS